MQKRYVDVVEAEARIKELFPDMPKIDFMDNVRNWREKNKQYLQCLDVIRSLPTADVVERKRGKWIPSFDRWGDIVTTVDGYTCSECGSFNTDKDNFCPNCGAEMK